MPPTIRLETAAPGQGLFRIAGIDAAGDDLELAIQRNLDDRYLGQGQAWQITPHWHRLAAIVAPTGELQVHAGPQIIDPVAAASNMALRVLIRRDGQEASGVLRITGHLLGSPAAREPDASGPPTAPPRAPVMEPDLELDPELLGERREPPPVPDKPGGRALGTVAGLLLLLLIIGAGLVVWWLGWLDEPVSPETPQEQLVATAPDQGAGNSGSTPKSATRDAPATPTADTAAPKILYGIELARTFLSKGPRPDEIQAEAERREQAADCDAAMILFNHAARADSRLASSLAGRLDPQGFAADGCIQAPDTTAASLWYRKAADAGDPAARRRLGQLLIADETSGAQFEEGVRLLRLAAQAGDQEAKDLLTKLGKL